MRPTTERLCLGIMLAVVLAFHAATLHGQSLFVDEVAEFQHARGPLAEVAFRADSMPPTFNLLVAAWSRTVGEGTSARAISVALSVAATLLVWRIGRRLGAACGTDPAATGIAASAVFSALPLQLYYAQLIRGYALLTFAAALVILVFMRAAADDRPRDWAAFAAAGVFGMWCHYYFAITLAMLLAILVWRRGAMIGRKPLLAGAAIVVGCLPLLPFLQQDFGYQHDLREPRPLTVSAVAYTGFSFFGGYTLGPSKSDLHQITATEAARQAAPWGLAIVISLLPLLAQSVERLRRGRWLAPIVLLTGGPVALVGLLGVASGITYNPRFVAWCVVPIALWLGLSVVDGLSKSGGARWITTGCCFVLAVIASIAIAQRHTVDRYQTEDLAAAAAWIAGELPPDAVVFIIADYLAPQIEFQAETLGLEIPTVAALPRPGVVDQVVTEDDLAGEAISHLKAQAGRRAFWLIECRAFHTDPLGKLHAAIKEAAELETAAEFAGVRIYRGELEAP